MVIKCVLETKNRLKSRKNRSLGCILQFNELCKTRVSIRFGSPLSYTKDAAPVIVINMKTKTLRTACDVGSIKIFSKEMSTFFSNGVGDVPNKVTINETINTWINKYNFLGYFTVKKNNSVHLSGYDCDDTPIYTFKTGRYFVYLKKPTEFLIQLVDNDVHA